MLIPSIDIQSGSTVQLVGGREKALDAGDPTPIAQRFGLVGEVAVIDLDAAIGTGSNEALITQLLPLGSLRIGGGIRSVDAALRWLDRGASKVILGTAATPDVLKSLPRARTIAALDAEHGDVVTHGWRTRTGRSILERIKELREYVGGFLITFVELEGRMQGTNLDQVAALVAAAGDARITIAGGVTTAEDIAALDRMGADAQVGMALYTGRLSLVDAFAAPFTSDRPDGLWPTVIADEFGQSLGLAYSNRESLSRAIEARRGVYWSRTRGLWEKGASSGHTQELIRIDIDCDRDAIRFTVRQQGPFCHTGTRTCFGSERGFAAAFTRIASQMTAGTPGSYSARLAADPLLLGNKLREEAAELADAKTPEEIVHEAADVVYFTMARLAAAGLDLASVAGELDRRGLTVSRRPGDAKPVQGSTRPTGGMS